MTAAALNAEIRDHCTFLKGALDLITASSTADTGDSTQIYVKRATVTDAIAATVTGDTSARFVIAADGTHAWGDGTNVRDIVMARSGASWLNMGNSAAGGPISLSLTANIGQRNSFGCRVSGDAVMRTALMGDATSQILEFGNGTDARDVNLYRGGPNLLKTDDQFEIAGTALVLSGGGNIQMIERSDLPNAPANNAYLWIGDNGAGKTRLLIRFATGNALVIATEA